MLCKISKRVSVKFLLGVVSYISRTMFVNCMNFSFVGQTVYKAVINDTTLASTPLFTVNVMDAILYGVTGEMSTGFTISTSGVVSTNQQLDVGRYEFIITVILQSDYISFLVGLVDVLSTSKPMRDILMHACIIVIGTHACHTGS